MIVLAARAVFDEKLQTLRRGDARGGDVELAVREDVVGEVDGDALECLAL